MGDSWEWSALSTCLMLEILPVADDEWAKLACRIPLMRRRPRICTENPEASVLEYPEAEIGHTGNGNMLNGAC